MTEDTSRAPTKVFRQTGLFPFNVPVYESVRFAVSGAYVESAALYCGQTLLSVFRPDYKALDLMEEPPKTELPFFGASPFHNALAKDWDLIIKIYTMDQRIPSLVIEQMSKSITWNDVGSDRYQETVDVYSADGSSKKD